MDSKIPINIDDSLSRHESIQARIDTRRRQQSSVPIKKKQKKIPLFTKHREGWKDAIEKAACNGWWHRSFGYGTSAHGCRPYPSLQRWHAHVKQRFRFRLSFSKVSSHGWLVKNLAILMDGITSCATYYLEYYPVSAASKFSLFFFFFYLSFVIHVDRWFVSLFPIFQRIAFPCRRFYQNARETGWFIHLKAVLIEKNFAFGLYSD